MKNMILTSENFLKIIDIGEILSNEVEVIELYGLNAFNRMSENNCIFILEDIFSCSDCEQVHLDVVLINFYGQQIEFVLDVLSIDCFGSCQVYDHNGEKRFLYSCDKFFL
jgi:hypothetical protein